VLLPVRIQIQKRSNGAVCSTWWRVALLGHIVYTRKPNKATCRATLQRRVSQKHPQHSTWWRVALLGHIVYTRTPNKATCKQLYRVC